MREFRFIALTPPGFADAAIAIAASRAGEIGVLDLQYARDANTALSGVARLARYARNECGIKLAGADQEQLLLRITSELPSQIKIVILTPADHGPLDRQIQTCRKFN